MQQDGQLKSLAERMREKAEQERIQTEAIFQEQLQSLSGSLLALSQNALHTMSDAMALEITAATGKLNSHYRILSMAYGRAWMRTAITALAMMVGLTAGGWVLMRGAAYWLDIYRTELAQVKADLNDQQQTLESLRAETWGLTLVESDGGRFIVLPSGWKPATGWTWSGRQAVKLEE